MKQIIDILYSKKLKKEIYDYFKKKKIYLNFLNLVDIEIAIYYQYEDDSIYILGNFLIDSFKVSDSRLILKGIDGYLYQLDRKIKETKKIIKERVYNGAKVSTNQKK